MTNVTFSVDDDLLRRARKLALDRDTTVTQLLRDYLEQLVASESSAAKQRAEEFRRVTRKLARHAGGAKFDREEIHDRPVLRRY
jgi:predicted transcriptional regulator